jgi:branched-chain amino acid transport system permease protein
VARVSARHSRDAAVESDGYVSNGSGTSRTLLRQPSGSILGDLLKGPWIRRGAGLTAMVIIAVLVAEAPSILGGYVLSLFTLGAIYAIAGLGMTVLLGWTGQISLLPAAFMGLGAYGTDWLFQQGHVPWGIAVVLTALSVSVLGMILAFPALRLRGFYLAIATLALAEAIVYGFTSFSSITGGNEGSYVTTISLFGITTTSAIWYLSMIVFAVAVLVMGRVKRSSLGRMFFGVRDAEVAMGPLAVSPVMAKLIAFAICCVLASLAGSLYAQAVTYVTPDQFDLPLLIELLVVVFLGGIDSVLGPPIGAAFVIILTEILGSVGSLEPIIFGGVLVLVILLLPRGIVSLPERLGDLRWFRRAVSWVGSRLSPGNRNSAASDPDLVVERAGSQQ